MGTSSSQFAWTSGFSGPWAGSSKEVNLKGSSDSVVVWDYIPVSVMIRRSSGAIYSTPLFEVLRIAACTRWHAALGWLIR